jgi:hypothetical protein
MSKNKLKDLSDLYLETLSSSIIYIDKSIKTAIDIKKKDKDKELYIKSLEFSLGLLEGIRNRFEKNFSDLIDEEILMLENDIDI